MVDAQLQMTLSSQAVLTPLCLTIKQLQQPAFSTHHLCFCGTFSVIEILQCVKSIPCTDSIVDKQRIIVAPQMQRIHPLFLEPSLRRCRKEVQGQSGGSSNPKSSAQTGPSSSAETPPLKAPSRQAHKLPLSPSLHSCTTCCSYIWVPNCCFRSGISSCWWIWFISFFSKSPKGS